MLQISDITCCKIFLAFTLYNYLFVQILCNIYFNLIILGIPSNYLRYLGIFLDLYPTFRSLLNFD